MGDVFGWIATNWMTVVGVAGTVVMGASIIVKALAPYTATKKDDEAAVWLDKVVGWLNKIAINPPRK
jgi:hypothetical protein